MHGDAVHDWRSCLPRHNAKKRLSFLHFNRDEVVKMRIHIIEIFEVNSQTAIRFASDIGVGVACWKSKGAPVVGDTLQVEFDINVPIEKGRNAFIADKMVFTMDHDCDHSIVLCGVVDSVDDDGMVYLRLTEDCLVMIESRAGHVQVGEWLLLRCKIESVAISIVGA